jgi:hypothetical protein
MRSTESVRVLRPTLLRVHALLRSDDHNRKQAEPYEQHEEPEIARFLHWLGLSSQHGICRSDCGSQVVGVGSIGGKSYAAKAANATSANRQVQSLSSCFMGIPPCR